jgi:hypothetical protein
MRSYLHSIASELNPGTIGSLKLGDLRNVYLYGEGAQQGPIRAKMVQMVSVGLWDADPPDGTREWKIRAGPVAIEFHLNGFAPVVEHFKKYLKGGFEGKILGREDNAV